MRIILLLIFTLLYMIGAHWFYTQKISNICCGGDAVNEVAATTPAIVDTPDEETLEALPPEDEDLGPLTFNWSDETPLTGDGFEDYKSSIFRNLSDNNVLEITGQYFDDEEIPDGYDNMGIARAEAIKKLFSSEMNADRIIVNSRLVDRVDGVEENPFEAANFNWIGEIKSDETTIAEIDDRTLIFFPFNSKIKDENIKMDNYLNRLADRMKETSEKVHIQGHTDSTGKTKYNYQLGLERALYIKKLLVAKGVNKTLISVSSKGETQPIASNRTPEGEHKNRRVVITLRK